MTVLVHLLLIVSGVAVALGALTYFAHVRGGWFSTPGLFTLAMLAVAVALILAGFGAIALPGTGVPA